MQSGGPRPAMHWPDRWNERTENDENNERGNDSRASGKGAYGMEDLWKVRFTRTTVTVSGGLRPGQYREAVGVARCSSLMAELQGGSHQFSMNIKLVSKVRYRCDPPPAGMPPEHPRQGRQRATAKNQPRNLPLRRPRPQAKKALHQPGGRIIMPACPSPSGGRSAYDWPSGPARRIIHHGRLRGRPLSVRGFIPACAEGGKSEHR